MWRRVRYATTSTTTIVIINTIITMITNTYQ